ncbi:type III-B CRISPR module-associated Cmr3 family protein [Moraxella bovoculi]|uniref:type III-B CRISPR module-associated Cmr3 family protein n=1 Tax=Moraxella bovoculi TaxID=386891 RepID=UPI003F50A838
MSDVVIKFEPVDTWFFRESRPHGSMGANALNSVFPPPVRTLMGAVRSWIGNEYLVKQQQSWDNLAKLPELTAAIGNEKQLGSIRPRGAFIADDSSDKTTYYLPMPVNVCTKSDDKATYLAFDLTQECFEADIGNIRLPELPKKDGTDTAGFKPMENAWLSNTAWERLLAGDLSALGQDRAVRQQSDFLTQEYRLGIEIDSHRQVQYGKLYQTTHLRLKSDISVMLPVHYNADDLKVLNQNLEGNPLVRVGGEARMASLGFGSADYLPNAPKTIGRVVNGKKRFMLYLLTKLPVKDDWLPVRFAPCEQGFAGVVRGVSMTIISACIGKAHREGGWNQLTHEPRAIENHLPAGSAFFVEVDSDVSDDEIRALHGQTFYDKDDDYHSQDWGYGVMLVGQIL